MLNFARRRHPDRSEELREHEDEKAWEKTSGLAGKLFWICGSLALVSLVSPSDLKLWIILLPVVLSAICVSAYAYLEYRKVKAEQAKKRNKGKGARKSRR